MLSAKPYVFSWDENRRQGDQQQTCKLLVNTDKQQNTSNARRTAIFAY